MEILAGIRLDELRTLCDACLLRLQAMFGDVQAESASWNPGAVADKPTFRVGTGLACIGVGLGRITSGRYPADTLELSASLERHPLPVVQYLQACAAGHGR